MGNLVITGAASGLGRQLALDLAEQGWDAALVDRDSAGLEETRRLIGDKPRTSVVTCDVTDYAQCVAMANQVHAELGRIDGLLLCAGVSMWARFDEVEDVSIFRKLVEVNYLGAVHCIHACLGDLKQARGSIVAVSSLQGEVAIPNHTGYSAAKKALNGFLEGLDFELGDRMHILTVLPGWITGTNLRSNAFRKDGGAESPRKHSRESVTVEECSRRIQRAMEQKKRYLFIPPKLALLPWLKLVAPGLLKRLIRRAVRAQR